MKFFIDKDTTIYLNQLLNAAGVIEDYRDIRHIINRGFVSVNEKNTFQQRKIIRAGDVVKFKKHHIKVLEHEPLKEKNDDLYSTPGIRHGKVNIWKTKPLKIEIELDKEIKVISQKIHEKLLSSNSTL
ncbi:MAG: RNA-binding S4 domain-containing protein, partial [Candidatus Cloacimonetes bacterium]|nr:RNA-binding S4 domain-containing protein [Candidatus Cloacimonadota bacterium]